MSANGSSRSLARFYFLLQRSDNFGERFGSLVAFRAMADGHGSGFGFLRAYDAHVRDLLELRVADFRRQLFVAIVEMRTKMVALESLGDVFRVVGDFFADWANLNLHRREPQRERARVVLNQNAEEAFDGAK